MVKEKLIPFTGKQLLNTTTISSIKFTKKHINTFFLPKNYLASKKLAVLCKSPVLLRV